MEHFFISIESTKITFQQDIFDLFEDFLPEKECYSSHIITETEFEFPNTLKIVDLTILLSQKYKIKSDDIKNVIKGLLFMFRYVRQVKFRILREISDEFPKIKYSDVVSHREIMYSDVVSHREIMYFVDVFVPKIGLILEDHYAILKKYSDCGVDVVFEFENVSTKAIVPPEIVKRSKFLEKLPQFSDDFGFVISIFHPQAIYAYLTHTDIPDIDIIKMKTQINKRRISIDKLKSICVISDYFEDQVCSDIIRRLIHEDENSCIKFGCCLSKKQKRCLIKKQKRKM